MKTQCALLIVLVTLIGCTVGPSVQTFNPATNPQGIHASLLTLIGSRIEGELLEVRDSGLVVLADDELVLAPYGSIRRARFDQMRRLNFGPRAGLTGPRIGLTDEKREELRLLSRFPQGIDGEVLNRLLAAYGQTKLTIAQ